MIVKIRRPLTQVLVDRQDLCKILGGVSVSHVIRLEKYPRFARARVQVGPRSVRYDIRKLRNLIASNKIF